ncbi:MAG TPA: PaaI family thioesterase [Nitrososphaerales archaeon]|nr:PaaI family thioesterase [Nitrososphaerales archaeon]
MKKKSLQERYAPSSVCFGCGPANEQGLKIRSVVEGHSVVARWIPRPYHHAFGNVLSGGIISTVLDCHSNWTGAYSLMVEAGAEAPPPTVTASIFVEFLRPTPVAPLLLEGSAKGISGRKVVVESAVKADGVVTATLRGTFVAVRADHPAARRWLGEEEGADRHHPA